MACIGSILYTVKKSGLRLVRCTKGRYSKPRSRYIRGTRTTVLVAFTKGKIQGRYFSSFLVISFRANSSLIEIEGYKTRIKSLTRTYSYFDVNYVPIYKHIAYCIIKPKPIVPTHNN